MVGTSKHEKTLFRVMALGTALAFGILAAVAVSMKDFLGGNATFEFSYKTVLAFCAGCLAGWFFWWIVRRKIRKAEERVPIKHGHGRQMND